MDEFELYKEYILKKHKYEIIRIKRIIYYEHGVFRDLICDWICSDGTTAYDGFFLIYNEKITKFKNQKRKEKIKKIKERINEL